MRSLVFEGNTWIAYEKLRERDGKLHRALCKLLKEMLRSDNPAPGLGKPEPLKHALSGLWSRRISSKDRLIYRFDEYSISVFAIGGHYDQRLDR
ncbi:MAG: Txe/YoeB family addiction module toxin [Gammaproteobacteria bacterium]|nr:Txe/YoeB family addiction module toxin [Gammaproteobacteria bacterium]